jgi:hypothetical protein
VFNACVGLRCSSRRWQWCLGNAGPNALPEKLFRASRLLEDPVFTGTPKVAPRYLRQRRRVRVARYCCAAFVAPPRNVPAVGVGRRCRQECNRAEEPSRQLWQDRHVRHYTLGVLTLFLRIVTASGKSVTMHSSPKHFAEAHGRTPRIGSCISQHSSEPAVASRSRRARCLASQADPK